MDGGSTSEPSTVVVADELWMHDEGMEDAAAFLVWSLPDVTPTHPLPDLPLFPLLVCVLDQLTRNLKIAILKRTLWIWLYLGQETGHALLRSCPE